MADQTNALSNYAENKCLALVLTQAAFTSPTAVYVSLHTASPGEDASGAECTYTGYARKAISFGASSGGAVSQDADVTFDQCTAGSNDATHYGIWDAVSGGNLLAYGQLAATKAISTGNTPSIASGEIVLTMSTTEMSTYLADKLMDHMFNNTAYGGAANTYFALATVALTGASTGSTITEPSGNNYSRCSVTGGWTVTDNSGDNDTEETFATPSGDWGTITALALLDASTLGNVLFFDNSPTGDGQAPASGDTVKIAAGAYTCTLD